MRALVIESDRHGAEGAVAELQHEGVRCHESGRPAFPCNALRDGGSCPLDAGDGVDVLVDHRAHAHPRPTPFEDGVSCAARRYIPIVVAGVSTLSPFDKWTTVEAQDGSVVDACERAATAPIESLAEVARTKARQLLAGDPIVAAATDVIVTRGGGRLEAMILLPDSAGELEGPLAVRVAGAIRTRDSWTPQVDVCVRRFSTSDAPGSRRGAGG